MRNGKGKIGGRRKLIFNIKDDRRNYNEEGERFHKEEDQGIGQVTKDSNNMKEKEEKEEKEDAEEMQQLFDSWPFTPNGNVTSRFSSSASLSPPLLKATQEGLG